MLSKYTSFKESFKLYVGKISVHLAFREATTGSCTVLLKVLRDTGRERDNGKLEKL